MAGCATKHVRFGNWGETRTHHRFLASASLILSLAILRVLVLFLVIKASCVIAQYLPTQ
jgi:ACR3 family arsenite efflux pump ArsB